MFNIDIDEVTRNTGIGNGFWLAVTISGVCELFPNDRLQVHDHCEYLVFRDDLRADADYEQKRGEIQPQEVHGCLQFHLRVPGYLLLLWNASLLLFQWKRAQLLQH